MFAQIKESEVKHEPLDVSEMLDLRYKVRTIEAESTTQSELSQVTDLSRKQKRECDSTENDAKVYTSNGNKLAFTIENLIKKRVESGEVSILKANGNVFEGSS